jgi:uncharacterized membrane protein YjjP (DUF1212 family)
MFSGDSMNEEQSEIAAQIHTTVAKLLEDGAGPSDVSFVLSMIATELGLEITEGSITVFPVVLSGISLAVANAVEAAGEEEGEVQDKTDDVPIGAIVH